MSDEWIDVKEKLPPDKTWVEARFKFKTFEMEMEWFYFAKDYKTSKSDKRVTHWRFITHPFFNPIAEQSFILELPVDAIR